MIIAIALTAVVCIGGTYMLTSSSSDTTTLKLEGSTTLSPLMEYYAEEFEKTTGVRVEITSNGSSFGISSVKDPARAHIGLSSSGYGNANHAGLKETPIGWDSVVIIAGSNAPSQLTRAQVEGIYKGTYTTWNQVGGTSTATIVPLERDDGSGTRDYFEGRFTVAGKPLHSIVGTSQAVIETVETNPNAIAYVSFGSVGDANVKVLALDYENNGTFVNPKTNFANYPLKRVVVLLTNGEPTGIAAVFIGWILSHEGQKLMVEEGSITPFSVLPLPTT
jgi:phosphate transport system substrate-binding protein